MNNEISIYGAKVHNLKNIDLTLPRNKLIVFTGLSGSGKSSLAFDTIFAEGQRRYMESLSSYARQFLDQMDKPDVDRIDGLSPAISIDQKSASSNPRSTVGTITEIYDYLRLLFASIGKPHCPTCKTPIQSLSVEEMVNRIMKNGGKVMIMSPIISNKKGEFKDILEELQTKGFVRARVNGNIVRLSDPIKLDKKLKHTIELVVDRLDVSDENRSRISESVESALQQSKGLVIVENTDTGEQVILSEKLSCPTCDTSLMELTPRLFSFNSPIGACTSCNGLGEKMDFDPDLVIANPENPVKTCTAKVLNLDGTSYGESLARTAKSYGFSMSSIYSSLTQKQKNIVLFGSETGVDENPFLSSDGPEVPLYHGIFGPWEGILTNLRRRYVQTQSEGMRFFFRNYMRAKPCTTCHGGRLKAVALSVFIQEKSISHLAGMSIHNFLTWAQNLSLTEQEEEISRQLLKEIKERLGFLEHVGLGYLSLSRKAGTLSGGEFQRIRLATQIGVGLTGVLYVLDEPSIGLHQRDNLKLIETLKKLRDLGNTLIIVEHDEDTIRQADFIVDIGPGAGIHGGHIIHAGTVAALLKKPESKTAHYLTGKEKISIQKKRQEHQIQRYLTLEGASENNLKNVTVKFPLSKLICVTGVSGSGKSTLINETLHRALMQHFYGSKERPGNHTALKGLEHIDKVITIDQSPIGRTPRSNPATYTDLFAPIRDLFAETKEAKIRGFKPGRFSFNVKGGRCEACEGDGMVKIEMHFLADVYVTCEICKGKRYNDQTLAVHYKGLTISQVLALSVDEAMPIFENIPTVANKLRTLQEVGLGYIHLGQSATTLSGGEAQRIKLAKELSKRSTGKTLYLLDEPTTGLHFADIHQLLRVLDRLVESGNTVIVIEHSIDVIRQADHIIDLGPEGGEGGGAIIAEGSPEVIKACKLSHTGKFI